jgi:hypothetical protein
MEGDLVYQAACKDVFNGGRAKALDSLKEFKFNRELQEFWSSVVNLGSDLSWVLVALAKRAEGEVELDEAIDSNWKLIKSEWPKYDKAAEEIAQKHHDYFFHEDSILMAARFFIEKCIEDRDKPNSPYHPYGFSVFMSMVVITSLDFHIWMMDDADENFENIKSVYPDMVDNINNLTSSEYIALSKLRLGLAQSMEVVSSKEITYAAFFKQDTNLKDFRNKLGAFISMDILRRQNTDNLSQLLRALGGIVGGIKPQKSGGTTRMPDDIDKIEFDD